jgi:hypothetical protein
MDLLPAILEIDKIQFQKDIEKIDQSNTVGLLPWLLSNGLIDYASQVR